MPKLQKFHSASNTWIGAFTMNFIKVAWYQVSYPNQTHSPNTYQVCKIKHE
jgi:hypothetical protein